MIFVKYWMIGCVPMTFPLEQIDEALQQDILDENEVDLLLKALKILRKVIDVDDFEEQELTSGPLEPVPNW